MLVYQTLTATATSAGSRRPLESMSTAQGGGTPGTWAEAVMLAGPPVFHMPSVTWPGTSWGATLASKRKLYVVPQRMALVLSAAGCGVHVMALPARAARQEPPSTLTPPAPSPPR